MTRFMSMTFVGLLFAGMVWTGCGKTESKPVPDTVRIIKMVDIARNSVREIREFSGSISPVQDVAMAFEVPGKLIELPVVEGQEVEKGQVLARLDDRDYKLAFDSKKAVHDTALKDFERAQSLLENQVISRKQYDDFRRNAEVADADMKAAMKKLEDAVMIAPFTGRVAKRLMDNYQNVQAKQTVLIFQDDSRLKFRVDVPEKDLAMANGRRSFEEEGRQFHPMVSLSAYPNRSFPAVFHEVSTTADPATRTFSVTLIFSPPKDIVILPGMTARLTITKQVKTDASDNVFAPSQAVFSDGESGSCVWVVHPESMTVSKRPVRIGEMSGSDIVIREGLDDGDIIAVSGVQQLREGMAVSRFRQ